MTKVVIDKITSAGVISYSPANTSPDFTTYADKGMYFRTAPSDVLQGRVLGETLVADGRQNVAILALQDPYGEGLALNVGLSVCKGGSNVPVNTVFYDPAASNFDAQVGQIKAAQPDAVVLVGFEESAKVIQAMVAQGIGPQDVPLYLVDGNLGNALGADLPPGLLEGTKGSLPGAEATSDFRAQLSHDRPARCKDYSYSGESYDAVVTTALGAPGGQERRGRQDRRGAARTSPAAARSATASRRARRSSRAAPRTSTTTASAARSSSPTWATRPRPRSASTPTAPTTS